MKKIEYFVLGLIAFMLGISGVNASADGAFEITDEVSFEECLEEESLCRLTKDLDITSSKNVDQDMILDLNGNTISPSPELKLSSGLLSVERGATLTINDSTGNGKISTGSGDNVWAAIQLIKKSSGDEVAELVVNGGTIEGYYYGVVGNGRVHNTKVTINGGIIKGLNQEDSVGIYQPQKGELIINGGTIMGGTGIEIRSGKLTINNGTISGKASQFVKMVNNNGTTTNGVGVAVAQHTTKNPIEVTIHGGSIEGQYAFYEWNPHNNSAEDLASIKLKIDGGNFVGLAQGVHAVYSQDFNNFISGGKFNTEVSEYLTDDAIVAFFDNDDLKVLSKEKKGKHIFIIFLVPFFLILIAIVSLIFCKKKKLLFFK